MVSVSVGGQSLEQLLDVQESGRPGDRLGSATIEVVDTSHNRSITAPNAPVVINRGGAVSFRGSVTGEPSSSDGTLQINALETRVELKHESVHQVFYGISRADAVRQIVTKQTRPLNETIVTTADDATQWSAQAPVAHVYSGTRAGLYRWGTDMVFLGARNGHSSPLYVTYEDVGTEAIRDGIFELRTRLLFNDPGGLFDLEVELYTPGGTTYVWEPTIEPGWTDYTLPAEEASPDGELSEPGTLQYRFIPSGRTSQNVGGWIDAARTIPFVLESRSTNIGTGGIQDTTDAIYRRADGPAGEVISDLATGAQAEWWVDRSDVLQFRPGSRPSTTLSIAQGDPVTNVEVDRDYEAITNKAIVEYAGGEEVEVVDQASVQFYGPTEPENLKPGVERESEAREFGEGYLEEHAWGDALATFTIADMSFAALSPGARLDVTWPPESLNGTFAVDSKEVEASGRGTVDVSIRATSS